MIEGASIGVVGGGPSGLTAALRLQRSGAVVTVHEARDEVGGRTRTDVVNGYRIDVFTQLFGSMYRAFFELLESVGGAGLAIPSPGRDALWRGGRIHEVTYGSVPSMLASGAVPMRTKLRLGARYLPFLTRHSSHLDMHTLAAAADAGLDGESIASWGERELGRDFVEYLAYPLLASYYGVLPEETTAALYHMLAHHGTNVTVFALRSGVGTFPELLAERIRAAGGGVRTGERVRSVERRGNRVAVTSEAGVREYDGVVVCLPGCRVPDVVVGLTPALEEWHRRVRYRPLAAVALLLDRPAAGRFFGLSFPRETGKAVSTVCLQENKGDTLGLVPSGRGLIVALLTPEEAAAQHADYRPEPLVQRVVRELSEELPGLEAAVSRAKVYRWQDGGPVFYPGYLRHIENGPHQDPRSDSNLVFGGDHLVVPGVEGSVISGIRAADALVRVIAHRSAG